jgi:hypothetical protein
VAAVVVPEAVRADRADLFADLNLMTRALVPAFIFLTYAFCVAAGYQ